MGRGNGRGNRNSRDRGRGRGGSRGRGREGNDGDGRWARLGRDRKAAADKKEEADHQDPVVGARKMQPVKGKEEDNRREAGLVAAREGEGSLQRRAEETALGRRAVRNNLLGGLVDIEVRQDIVDVSGKGGERIEFQRNITGKTETRISKDGVFIIDGIDPKMDIEALVIVLMKHIVGDGRDGIDPFPRKIEFDRNIDPRTKQALEKKIMQKAESIYQIAIGRDRPPEDPRNIGLRNNRIRALIDAQSFNEERGAKENFLKNIEKLEAAAKAGSVIYVQGQSAMGQGDTAFIVRTVKLLRSLGLHAVGVQAGAMPREPQERKAPAVPAAPAAGSRIKVKGAFEGGNSFAGVIEFVNPEDMMNKIKASDFIIEGPLNKPIPARDGTFHDYNFDQQIASKVEKSDEAATTVRQRYEGVRKLRLYEYGSLSLKAGELRGNEDTPVFRSNVAHFGKSPGHAFMGMGAGEIGAFYSSRSPEEIIDLDSVLREYQNDPVGRQIVEAIKRNPPGTPIFLGYANKTNVTLDWAVAVDRAAPRGAIIIGVVGERHENAAPQLKPEGKDHTILVVKGIPSLLMDALRSVAQPFTLSTGNFSLSEAIETGQFSIYESLDFNGSVSNSYNWQLSNALEQLHIHPDLARAITSIIKKGTAKMRNNMVNEIAILLKFPAQVKLIMEFIKSNTDNTAAIVDRLAGLIE